MPEAGGTATQAGIFYQNSVAALALADLLDLDQRAARERLIEVRLEAPEDVDDVVLRYADGHREYQNVKLSIQRGNSAWDGIWKSLSSQLQSGDFGVTDELTLILDERNTASDTLITLCDRARSSVDEADLRKRLTTPQIATLDSIKAILGSGSAAFEVLRRTSVRHLPQVEIERELARKRLAGGQSPSPTLLPVLRDIAGGDARKRGLFHPAPLRRRLKAEHDILLEEPLDWGLAAYRDMIRQLSRIEIPGTGISGAAEELFVWPRAQLYDRGRPSGFEDEDPQLFDAQDEPGLDLRTFPSEELHRLVVVAGPGYGKSALLTAIAAELTKGPIIPVHVPLASLASADVTVMAFLNSSINQEMDLSADWQLLAEQGLLVLLFDGLDEVPSAARPRLMQRISTFSARYPRAPWILTVRDAAVVTGLPEASVIELLPLSDEDIERFVEAMKFQLGEEKSWLVVRRINLYPDIDRLARIPLFLVMLLATTDLSRSTSLRRSDLIEAYLKTLFSPAHHKPLQDSVDRSGRLRQIAQALAFERLERQEIGATEREVRLAISRLEGSSEEAAKLFEQLIANGILKPQSSIRLQFPYPIVQEYLAACHLIEQFPESLEQRIDDAIQRPWAQVIQFGLELHPEPEPIIKAMLDRPDDAFCTGLRLVGRCIANGATVSSKVRVDVGDRLTAFWVHAPSRARERVGRLLTDGFTDPISPALRHALRHRWLIEWGAGDIVTKVGDNALTLEVLGSLLKSDRTSHMTWHSLAPALCAAGDLALQTIIDALDPDVHDAEALRDISSIFSNFTSDAVSRDLALSVARDSRLPPQARMRAYALAGRPLEKSGIEMAKAAFRNPDWDSNYEASYLVPIHDQPADFIGALLRDTEIPLKRRSDLAGKVALVIPDPAARRIFFETAISDPSIDSEVRVALRLFAARLGDRKAYEGLIEQFPTLPIQHVGTTLSLFGHYPDRDLAERAADLICGRSLDPHEIARCSNGVTTGMQYIFEMDIGFSGILRSAPPHPGIRLWREVLEGWSKRPDLSTVDRINVLTQAARIGSDGAASALERAVLELPNPGGSDWSNQDKDGHTLSHAIGQVQRRLPTLPLTFIEQILESPQYNIASQGISALEAIGDEAALRRLIDLHASHKKWSLRDTAANTIELMAARLQRIISKVDGHYVLGQ